MHLNGFWNKCIFKDGYLNVPIIENVNLVTLSCTDIVHAYKIRRYRQLQKRRHAQALARHALALVFIFPLQNQDADLPGLQQNIFSNIWAATTSSSITFKALSTHHHHKMYHALPPPIPPTHLACHQPTHESSSKQKKGATLNVACADNISRSIQNHSGMAVCSEDVENCLFWDISAAVLIL